MAIDVYGFWCSVVAWSALTNTLTIDFITPYTSDPDGIAICATDNTNWSPDNFKLRSFESQDPISGNITKHHLNDTFLTAAPANWTHNVLEFGTVHEIIGNDPYYSESYEIEKFDDLSEAHPGVVSPSSQVRSNCVMVSVPLKHQTQYRASFEVTAFAAAPGSTPTPAATPVPTPTPSTGNGTGGNGTAGTPSAPVSGVDTTAPIVHTGAIDTANLWVAPLSFDRISETAVRYSVRGRKDGQMCGTMDKPPTYTKVTAQNDVSGFCATYQALRRRLLLWQESDKLVNARNLKLFLDAIPKLADEYYIRTSNATYYRLYRIDGRRRDLISRRTGILPNCNKCEGGWFKDHLTGELRYPIDLRFDNLNMFRYVGYVMLNSWAEYRCDDLFNPDLAKTPFPLRAATWKPWPQPIERWDYDFRPL